MVWKINFTPFNVTIFITRVHNCVKGATPMFAIGGTFQIRTHIINISKGDGKDKELMQSSTTRTTPDTTNHSQFHRAFRTSGLKSHALISHDLLSQSKFLPLARVEQSCARGQLHQFCFVLFLCLI